MTDLYADLTWLPRAPEDFNARCKVLRDQASVQIGSAVNALAMNALNSNQLNRLANIIAAGVKEAKDLAPLASFRLGILSNSTTDFLVPAIVATGARYGLHIQCTVGDYGQIIQTAMDPASAINTTQLDAVLVAMDYHALPLQAIAGDEASAKAAVARSLDVLANIRDALKANSGATVIFQTLARSPETFLGSFDILTAGSDCRQIEEFNRGLVDLVRNTTDRVFDVGNLAETVGLGAWSDPAMWNLAKQPFSPTYIPLYADHLCRIIAAMRGKSKKVLVLDLDNTVWGGVIGDDGMDGIKIAQGDATGEAHLAVQRTALALRERGVVLAVSSKNNDEIARAVFRDHPEMLLREEHIAVFQANWDDKASNIKAIAEALSLGLDSLVFLDDNPTERGLVRQLLPQVSVPELPLDPALYSRTLLAAGYFEAVAFSEEDRQRASFYSDNARRVALQQKVGGVEDYLRSLDMEIIMNPFDDRGVARITQLINKSNQFNLTTKRYTESEISALIGSPDALAMQVRLTDTFGDNGMISVVICRPSGSDWEIDTWLMSCRVLGRNVDNAILEEVVRVASLKGIRNLIGVYKPTNKNAMVKDHYHRHGFTLAQEQDDGVTVWNLPINTSQSGSAFIGRKTSSLA